MHNSYLKDVLDKEGSQTQEISTLQDALSNDIQQDHEGDVSMVAFQEAEAVDNNSSQSSEVAGIAVDMVANNPALITGPTEIHNSPFHLPEDHSKRLK